jgi:hypothetical protein
MFQPFFLAGAQRAVCIHIGRVLARNVHRGGELRRQVDAVSLSSCLLGKRGIGSGLLDDIQLSVGRCPLAF